MNWQILVCAAGLMVFSCNTADKEKESASEKATADSITPIPEARPVERPAPLTGTAAQLEGIWLIQDKSGAVVSEGINLKENGNANSINNTSVLYKTWQYPGNDTLVMEGKKRMNGEDILVSDTFRINSITDSVLVLQKGKITRTYRRS